MGGLISMYYTPKHPDRVTHVVLNDIGPEIAQAGLERIMAMLTGAPQAFTDLKAVAKYYREANAPMLAHRSDDEVLEYARWHVRKNDVSVYTWKMDPAVRSAPPAPPPMDPWEAYRAIACPLLIVRGGTSDVLSPETAQKMLAENANARLVEAPGIGHAPSLTEREVYPVLESFLGE
jgi:pimeloyl-ACP methyl ester carboxylesterase